MKKFAALSIFLLLLFITGCATIFNGTSEEVSIQSNPEKAKIVVKNHLGVEIFNGKTPAVVKLPSKREYIISISLEGYNEATVPVTQSFNGLFLGNIFCGGIIGMIIDYANGAMWDLEPEAINISLVSAVAKDSGEQTYAVFRAMDDNGEIRTLVVPMIKSGDLTAVN